VLGHWQLTPHACVLQSECLKCLSKSVRFTGPQAHTPALTSPIDSKLATHTKTLPNLHFRTVGVRHTCLASFIPCYFHSLLTCRAECSTGRGCWYNDLEGCVGRWWCVSSVCSNLNSRFCHIQTPNNMQEPRPLVHPKPEACIF
jgi:hypothetical protein